MIKGSAAGTDLKIISNGWLHLSQQDGYTCIMKSFDIEDVMRTIYIDNWGVQPVSVHTYDMKDLVVSEDWTSIHDCNSLVHYGSIGEAIYGLMEYIHPTEYYDVLKAVTMYLGHENIDEMLKANE